MADEEYDMIFKVVLIGDSGVGKTNILSRYVRDDFSIETKSTVGVEFGSKVLKVNNTSIKIQIWDTAGQERYKSITKAYYKGAKGAFVVYDITRKETFSSVEKWVDELKNNGDELINGYVYGPNEISKLTINSIYNCYISIKCRIKNTAGEINIKL